jgi:hypothetical protein
MSLMQNQKPEEQQKVVVEEKAAEFSHDPDQSW